MRTTLTMAACLGLIINLSACGKKTQTKSGDDANNVAATLHQWGYIGEEAPEHWAELGGKNALCATGKRQSPIDLSGTMRAQNSHIELDYESSNATIQNNGHTIVVTPANAGGIRIDGTFYKLKYISYHAQSEHAINGHRAALETDFVHQNDKGEMLNIGVLSEIGTADPLLASIWTYLPEEAGPQMAIPDLLINPRDFMPSQASFYVYSGSITTPPCSEGVTWMVYTTSMSVSVEQVDAFSRLIGPNSRPLQTRNLRDILAVN